MSKSLEAIILEGNIKFFTSNHRPLSSGFSQVILKITELVETLTESYLKARLVIRLGFSLLLRLLKIMGQFKITVPSANDCDIGLLSQPIFPLFTFILYRKNIKKIFY